MMPRNTAIARSFMLALLFISLTLPYAFGQKESLDFMRPINWGYEDVHNAIIFNSHTPLYSAPNDSSKPAAYLNFKDQLTLFESGYDKRGMLWYRVHTNLTGISGYIKANELAKHYYPAREGFVDYVMRVERKEEAPWTVLKIIKAHTSSNNKIDSFEMPLSPSNYRIKEVFRLALPGVGRTFCVEQYRTSCPGMSKYTFIGDVKGKLKQIVSGYNMGEYGYYEFEEVYLPVWTEGGTVELAQYAHMANRFYNSQKPGPTVAYPKSFLLPPETLVIRKEELAESEVDANGKEILIGEHEPKMKIHKQLTRYYRWDGEKLIEFP